MLARLARSTDVRCGSERAVRATIFAALLCLVSTGCSGTPELGLVSGQILVDGKPVEGLSIAFNADTTAKGVNGVASGVTDREGRFTLQATQRGDAKSKPGALPGMHRVVIQDLAAQPSADYDTLAQTHVVPPTKPSRIAGKLGNLQTTPLKSVQVNAGEQRLTIEISTRTGAATVKSEAVLEPPAT
ncbi:MAG: hypothetical protein QM811_11150 [Pirellulales bacterium]